LQTLSTRRLLLRPLTLEDLPAVHALASDPEVARYMRFPVSTSLAMTHRLVTEYLEAEARGDALPWTVAERATGRTIGVFVLSQGDDGCPGHGISVYLAPSCWGKGYLSELLPMISDFAFNQLQTFALTAHIVQDNTASCHVFLKNGFVLRDLFHYPDCDLGVYVKRPPV
jgi:ribosomal-protein-alanine N-acetyltransferase